MQRCIDKYFYGYTHYALERQISGDGTPPIITLFLHKLTVAPKIVFIFFLVLSLTFVLRSSSFYKVP